METYILGEFAKCEQDVLEILLYFSLRLLYPQGELGPQHQQFDRDSFMLGWQYDEPLGILGEAGCSYYEIGHSFALPSVDDPVDGGVRLYLERKFDE